MTELNTYTHVHLHTGCGECSENRARMESLREDLAKAEATWRKEVRRGGVCKDCLWSTRGSLD